MSFAVNTGFVKNTAPFVDTSLFKKMDFWSSKNYNILIKGVHGIGKTLGVINYLEAKGINYKYFSCSTLNPWLHFIGVPEKRTGEDGKDYIDFILPKGFDDQVEVIILDEYNRCKDKNIKNATMELLQFRSINGRKFEKLRYIIACVNPDFDDDDKPDDLDYDVEPIDPAQLDRFQIQFEMPYMVNTSYFIHAYGKEYGLRACKWWKALSNELKLLITPRRLDYVLEHYLNGGDVKEMMHKKFFKKDSGCKSFVEAMMALSVDDQVEKAHQLYQSMNRTEAAKLINKDAEFFNALKSIHGKEELWQAVINKQDWCHFWFQCMTSDHFLTLFTTYPRFRKAVFNSSHFIDYIEPIFPFYITNVNSGSPEVKMITDNFAQVVNSKDEYRRKAAEVKEHSQFSFSQ
ncbi:TPA: ATP-binding protein [Aeromonas veronii]|nr:hypothetical protein [Aeromonas veronii]